MWRGLVGGAGRKVSTPIVVRGRDQVMSSVTAAEVRSDIIKQWASIRGSMNYDARNRGGGFPKCQHPFTPTVTRWCPGNELTRRREKRSASVTALPLRARERGLVRPRQNPQI